MLTRLYRQIFIVFIITLSATLQFAIADNILVFGDSLSAGYGISHEEQWSTLLSAKLQQTPYKRYHIVNLSISGEDSRGGLARLPKALAQYQPKILILELGGNDGLRGQSIKSLKQNLSTMINMAQQQNTQVLLVGMKIPPNYGKRYTKSFEASYAQLQQQYQLPFLPFMLEGIAGNPKLMQQDGIHPNAQAQPLILNNIWPVLKPLLRTTKN